MIKNQIFLYVNILELVHISSFAPLQRLTGWPSLVVTPTGQLYPLPHCLVDTSGPCQWSLLVVGMGQVSAAPPPHQC